MKHTLLLFPKNYVKLVKKTYLLSVYQCTPKMYQGAPVAGHHGTKIKKKVELNIFKMSRSLA